MKKWIVVGLLTATFSTMCLMGNLTAAELEIKFDLSNGYRVDDLNWNKTIDINGINLSGLSELTWSDLEIYQVNVGITALLSKAFYLRSSFGFGWILDGSNQDSDFFVWGNRALEFSRSNNRTDDGDVLDVHVGIGYPFNFAAGRFRLVPLVGYSHKEQNLKITDGFQTIPPTGPFANLNSTYETEWKGPWIGMDLSFGASEKMTLFAGLEYHWADYYAVANWNLRPDRAHPKSFEHEADGTGIMISAGGEYVLSGPWSVGLNLSYQDWSTDAGIDRIFFADGSVAEDRLNEVNWDSLAIMLGMTYRFQYHFPR